MRNPAARLDAKAGMYGSSGRECRVQYVTLVFAFLGDEGFVSSYGYRKMRVVPPKLGLHIVLQQV